MLTLEQARIIISENNGTPIAKSTISRWAREGILFTTHFGYMRVVSRKEAHDFVIADRVPRKGNPGYKRPKCDYGHSNTRCLKTSRWRVTVHITLGHNPNPLEMLRCDEHKDVLVEKAKEGSFEITKLEKLTHEAHN